METNTKQTNKPGFGSIVYQKCQTFFLIFFKKSGIHGFFHFSQTFLSKFEYFFWLILVIGSIYSSGVISLQIIHRYETKNTVMTIEKDHYYWNTTLPSFTICPLKNRIDMKLFNEYCYTHNIEDKNKEEFYQFIESLANSTYNNFNNIKDFKSIEELNLDPQEYMALILSLTENRSRLPNMDEKIRAVRNTEFIRSEQILTEHGICYTTNNYLAYALSSIKLINGLTPQDDPYYKDNGLVVNDVIFGNLFDGDMVYNMMGFTDHITIYVHSPYETINIAKGGFYTELPMKFYCHTDEIVSHENFQERTTINQRHCRYHSESNLTHFQTYTLMLCIQECRLNMVYDICKCIPHFYPNKIKQPKKVCHYKVLKGCVARNKAFFTQLRDASIGIIRCPCSENCVDTNIFLDTFQMLRGATDLLGTIGGIITIETYPLIRYKRKILFSLTDLLVSIGGTAALFLGFCVLGAIEIVYFFTLRLFWYILGKR